MREKTDATTRLAVRSKQKQFKAREPSRAGVPALVNSVPLPSLLFVDRLFRLIKVFARYRLSRSSSSSILLRM